MINDAFLDELRADWRGQTIDVDRIRGLVEARRRAARRAMQDKLGGATIAAVFGGWFVYRALAAGDALYAVAGIALLVAIPFIFADYAASRRVALVLGDDTPSGVLIEAGRQVEALRHVLWGCRVAAGLLLICAAAVLGLLAAGLVTTGVAVLLGALWSGTALATWLWQSWRGRRLAAEAERCEHLLAELAAAD